MGHDFSFYRSKMWSLQNDHAPPKFKSSSFFHYVYPSATQRRTRPFEIACLNNPSREKKRKPRAFTMQWGPLIEETNVEWYKTKYIMYAIYISHTVYYIPWKCLTIIIDFKYTIVFRWVTILHMYAFRL